MKSILPFIAFLFIIFQAQSQNSYLIKNIHLIPMTKDTVLKNQMIWIRDGKIQSFGKSILNSEVKELDGKGMYMMPGLMDMHVHLQDKKELGLYLANGVTTIRNLQGMPWHLRIRKKINQGKLLGPILFTSSPQLSGSDDKDPTRKKIKKTKKAIRLVKKYKRKGYDFIKTYNRLPLPIFETILKTAKEENIPIIAHPSFKMNYDFHFQEGISSIEHTEDVVQQPLRFKLDTLALDSIIDGYAKTNVYHCPTLSVYFRLLQMLEKGELILETQQSNYMNPFMRKRAKKELKEWLTYQKKNPEILERMQSQHEFHLEIIRQMHLANVRIVCGTDAGILFNPPGFSIHAELDFYKKAGMNNYNVLRTATFEPSQMNEHFRDMGTIEKGKIANLILTKNNPLEDLSTLRNPEFVFIKGQLLSKNDLEKFKQKALNRGGGFFTFIKYGWYIAFGK